MPAVASKDEHLQLKICTVVIFHFNIGTKMCMNHMYLTFDCLEHAIRQQSADINTANTQLGDSLPRYIAKQS